MNKLLSCRYNMDTNRVEARFEGGTILSIDCIAIEDEYGNTPAQRAELDWLLYHKPLEYAQLVLSGDYEYVTNCITFYWVIDKHMRYHYKNIEQTCGYTSAQYFALLFFRFRCSHHFIDVHSWPHYRLSFRLRC